MGRWGGHPLGETGWGGSAGEKNSFTSGSKLIIINTNIAEFAWLAEERGAPGQYSCLGALVQEYIGGEGNV